MPQTHHEGVIKFQLDFQEDSPPPEDQLRELNAWRSIFVQLGLLGQEPDRYGGYGFGNLSRRLSDGSDSFLISGTQTGHFHQLSPQHYATVQQCDPFKNQIRAHGQVKPSSEALSHGIIYQTAPEARWVMHLHSPEIFQCAGELALPTTPPAEAYGTPGMARAIEQLVQSQQRSANGLLVMGGHEDGILAYGRTASETGTLVIEALALARESRHPPPLII